MNEDDVKGLPTKYDGTQFRSRTEARHAMFFDLSGIQYHYEYEGFDLDGVWYVPDFYLPRLQSWIEIKPFPPTEEEQEKCERLARATEMSTFCFVGNPSSHPFDKGSAYAWTPAQNFNRDSSYNFIQCYKCGAICIGSLNHTYVHRCGSKTDSGAKADGEAPRLKWSREVVRRFRFDEFK